MPQKFLKDPESSLDYSIDWSEWLETGDAIDSSDWVASDGIDIMVSPAPSNTATVTTVWLSGGTAGQSYRVTNTIETSAGRTDERSIIVRVAER